VEWRWQSRFFAKKYENATGWQIIKMRCGHGIIVDRPRELAAVLDGLA
jgi:hypothetical protein